MICTLLSWYIFSFEYEVAIGKGITQKTSVPFIRLD